MKNMKNNWVENLIKTKYTWHFVFNLLVLATVYKIFGWEWFWVIAIADITRDLGTIIRKLYEK